MINEKFLISLWEYLVQQDNFTETYIQQGNVYTVSRTYSRKRIINKIGNIPLSVMSMILKCSSVAD